MTISEQIYAKMHNQAVTVLAGYAGTGKTTIISQLVPMFEPESVYVCAPTGKAAAVLCSKNISASTIHQLMYRQISQMPLTFEKRVKLPSYVKFLIIDEASMIDTQTLSDILEYKVPVLFVGDPFQLPPVQRDPKLFSAPDFFLHEIFRTDNNKILDAATQIRQTSVSLPVAMRQHDMKILTEKTFLERFWKASEARPMIPTMQLIVGYNASRTRLNNLMKRSENSLPTAYDKIICTKNNHELGINNGEIFFVLESNERNLKILPYSETDFSKAFWTKYDTLSFQNKKLPSRPKRDLAYFDFGYAITCHKSQGSEWENVYCKNEPLGEESARWSYTALTRAISSFILVS